MNMVMFSLKNLVCAMKVCIKFMLPPILSLNALRLTESYKVPELLKPEYSPSATRVVGYGLYT